MDDRALSELSDCVESVARVPLVPGPTPLERGPILPGGARLWVKRDDLTGLGAGGNKARKLEYLCADARRSGAQALVTVGAAQSNHCRMTAAAGAVLGMDVHLVLSGGQPAKAEGNQLLSQLFGARIHFTGADDHHWDELEAGRESVSARLEADGVVPYSIPIGGSTALGALGYARAMIELAGQFAENEIEPRAVVHTTSSGGTHAGLVAGRALILNAEMPAPDIVGIGVAKGVNRGRPDVAVLAQASLDLLGADGVRIDDDAVLVDPRWMGDDYAVPTREADDAIRWAARTGGWVLDRVYSGKGMAGLLGRAASGEWGTGDDVVFIHTGGLPSVFATDGAP